jgi:ABC-type molybdate transport system substrate-binding protein
VPQSLYTAIEQQAVLLNGKAGARAFMLFVQSTNGTAIIDEHGYQVP